MCAEFTFELFVEDLYNLLFLTGSQTLTNHTTAAGKYSRTAVFHPKLTILKII